ncbi:MAG: hypothetical protein WCH46_01875 [bacterium]
MLKISHLLLLLLAWSFVSCDMGTADSDYKFFGWKRDGSGIVVAKINYNTYPYPNYAKELLLTDQNGATIKTIQLEKAILEQAHCDRLFFAGDGSNFFAQIDDDIYLVNSNTGAETLLLAGKIFMTGSGSGKSILTMKKLSPDSIVYEIFTFENGTLRTNHSTSTPKVNFSPNTAEFIADSLLVGCTFDSGKCSVTIFDTSFNIRFSTSHEQSDVSPSLARISNQLLYTTYSNEFYLLNLTSRNSTYIISAPQIIHSNDLSPNSDFFIYTVSDNKPNVYNRRSLYLFNIQKKSVQFITQNLSSSAQLSPDGKSIAYLVHEDKDDKLHVIPVP